MSLNAHLIGNIESVKFSSPWPSMAEETATTTTSAVKRDNVCVSSSISHDAHGQVSLNVGGDRLSALIDRLSQTHAQVDEYTRRRTEQISLGTQQIIEKILEETKEKQRELLFDAQQQSQFFQEQYQADLQAKINHLNEDKAQQLSQLEKHLNEEQESILIRARERIDWLQRDANQVSDHFPSCPSHLFSSFFQKKIHLLEEAKERTNARLEEIADQVVHMGQEDSAHRLATTTTTVITTEALAQSSADHLHQTYAQVLHH